MQEDADNLMATAFRRECSVRRALQVLEVKHRRIQDDLQQFVQHLKLLVPGLGHASFVDLEHQEILEEALIRLGDDAFAEIVLKVLERGRS